MLKKMLTVGTMLAGILFAIAPLSHATLGLTTSSTTVPGPNTQFPFIFQLRKGEAANYIAITTSVVNPGTTIQLEYSTNMQNWVVFVASACGPGGLGVGLNGNTPPFASDTFLRWNIISTGAAPVPITLTIQDIDDNITQTKNTKQADIMYLNDDSFQFFGYMNPDKYRLGISSGGSDLPISSATQLSQSMAVTADKAYPFTAQFSSYTQQLDKVMVVLRSTGTGTVTMTNGITLSAIPTISTASARDGDILLFTSNTSSITFQSNQTLPGSALILGSTTRALGIGDFLELVYLRGFWREVFFSNNIEP